jgi:hypothetical protein
MARLVHGWVYWGNKNQAMMALNIAPKSLELAQPHKPAASPPAYALPGGFGTNSINYQLRYDLHIGQGLAYIDSG